MSQENQNIQEEPHKRRVRYKGKYPRNYKEKYKELNPEKYQDTIQHVIQKGNTPAGMHISHYGAGDSGLFADPAGAGRI